MLESSQARLGGLEGDKERLITAYTKGVLTLDELAAQKHASDKEIAALDGGDCDPAGGVGNPAIVGRTNRKYRKRSGGNPGGGGSSRR